MRATEAKWRLWSTVNPRIKSGGILGPRNHTQVRGKNLLSSSHSLV